jgi:hypothetical protein
MMITADQAARTARADQLAFRPTATKTLDAIWAEREAAERAARAKRKTLDEMWAEHEAAEAGRRS